MGLSLLNPSYALQFFIILTFLILNSLNSLSSFSIALSWVSVNLLGCALVLYILLEPFTLISYPDPIVHCNYLLGCDSPLFYYFCWSSWIEIRLRIVKVLSPLLNKLGNILATLHYFSLNQTNYFLLNLIYFPFNKRSKLYFFNFIRPIFQLWNLNFIKFPAHIQDLRSLNIFPETYELDSQEDTSLSDGPFEAQEDDEYIFMPETVANSEQPVSKFVFTAYKRVDKKIHPVSTSFPPDCRVSRQVPEDPMLTLPTLPTNPPDFIPTTKITEERMDELNVNSQGFLWPEEEKLFKHIMKLNQDGIAFQDIERGTLKESYFSPYIIPTVPHVPWEERNIPIPPSHPSR